MQNIGEMMKQARKLQDKMAGLQKELETRTVETTAGGGMVAVVVNGKFELQSLKIERDVDVGCVKLPSGNHLNRFMAVFTLSVPDEDELHLRRIHTCTPQGMIEIPADARSLAGQDLFSFELLQQNTETNIQNGSEIRFITEFVRRWAGLRSL